MDEILQIELPYQIFVYLYSDEIIDLIRDQTNIFMSLAHKYDNLLELFSIFHCSYY